MKLSTRLALAFSLVATLPLLALSPLVLRQVTEAFDDEYAGRLAAASRTVEAERRVVEAEVAKSLDAVAASQAVKDVAGDIASGWADPAEIVPVAGELMAPRGLEVLAILDDEGRVLTSGHLPARVGDPDPAALELSKRTPGRPSASWVEIRSDEGISKVLAVVAARPVDHAGIRLHVLAGVRIGPAFAERLSTVTGAAIEILDSHSGETLAAAGRTSEIPSGWPGIQRDRSREVPLGELATIRARLGAASLASAQRRILATLAALLLGSVALACLLGVFLARRIVRPVEALADGARHVAQGDLSHRVEVRTSGELGQLVDAFNGMTSDLARERERAAVAERIAAWREVARRLAHEIKNPLTPIAMSVETLRDAWHSKSPHLGEIFDDASRAVLEEVARLKKIVDEFSRFARLPPPELKAERPEELIGQILALHPAPREGIELHTDIPNGLPAVRADRDQVIQVLLNLVQNAEQAMERGRIELRARRDGGAVVFEVADRGPGIDPAQVERIFEPYFTTKESGTGLGLPIARRIAEEHGGSLTVQSAPGAGATFRLRLPAAEKAG